MSAIALKKLQMAKKGFVLQIEAGRIDHVNHTNDAFGALMETAELDQVLDVVDDYISKNPKTLVIVTSDHGTGGFGVYGTGPDYNDSTIIYTVPMTLCALGAVLAKCIYPSQKIGIKRSLAKEELKILIFIEVCLIF